MILKIAWKNIWRQKTRSIVVIIAIALGLIAGTFASSIVNGMMVERMDAIVKKEVSHFQIHQSNFRDEYLSTIFLPDGEKILSDLSKDKRVKFSTGRVISTTMIATANYSGGLRVNGIDPEQEANTTQLNERITDGKYFEGVKRNPILISENIAEKYKLKIRSKVVLTMQDNMGEIVASAFKVVGIINSNNAMIDESNVFVRKDDLRELLKLDQNSLHEVAALLHDHELAEQVAIEYQEKYTNLDVLPWLDLSLGMRMMADIGDMYSLILVGIILLALMFSIINTMLMAVLERVREIGMLMAVGMTKQKVFSMIMMETVFLSLIGGPIGLLISWLLISYFGDVGLNLYDGDYAENYGFSSIMYPYLNMTTYINISIMVIVMSIISAIFPARKALKLNPVEAIRKI